MKTIQKATPEELEAQIVQGRNQLRTERMDMSFGEIISMYERGEIVIRPAFQRAFRWDITRRTRFIESLLLGIPIPPIFVAENEEGLLEVVDGLQRLSTIFSFFGVLKSENENIAKHNNWVLEKGDRIAGLEGYDWMALPQKHRFSIKRYACRVEIIRWDSDYDMRFELFNRLNTGGVSLTPQEIRNAIYRDISPKFNEFTYKLASIEEFKKLIALNQSYLDTLYDQELVLRFVSLYKKSENVHNNMSQHMSIFMGNALNSPNFDYDIYETVFTETVKILYPLGNKIFKQRDGQFTLTFYDAIMIGLAENLEKYENIDFEVLRKKISEVRNDKRLRDLSGRGGNDFRKVKARLKRAKEIFSQL